MNRWDKRQPDGSTHFRRVTPRGAQELVCLLLGCLLGVGASNSKLCVRCSQSARRRHSREKNGVLILLGAAVTDSGWLLVLSPLQGLDIPDFRPSPCNMPEVDSVPVVLLLPQATTFATQAGGIDTALFLTKTHGA